MKRLLIAAAAIAVSAVPLAAQARDTSIKLDAIVAVVGNVPITRYDIERRLADSIAIFRSRNAPLPGKDKQREIALATLNDLVDEEVLVQRAKELAVDIPDVEVNAFIDNLMKDVTSKYPSTAAFRQDLVNAGYATPEEYRRTMTTQYRRTREIETLMRKLQEEGKMAPVVVPESRVQQEFVTLQNSGIRRRLASVAWRQMVVAPLPSAASRAAARAKIDSLRAEIVTAGDFERVAKRESMDASTKDLGGDLGWRRRGDLPVEIERLLFGPFQIRPGEVSQVVESPFGFHLIRLDRANPPVEVKVRQILIIPKIDSVDVERARKLADSLVLVLRAGASFDTVARAHHDRAEDAPGLIPEQPFDSLPGSYQTGLKDVKKDSIVAFPIPTAAGHPKFVIAQVATVTEPGEYTYDEVKARIRFQLQQIMQTRRYIDQARKEMYVVVYPDRAAEAATIFDRGGN